MNSLSIPGAFFAIFWHMQPPGDPRRSFPRSSLQALSLLAPAPSPFLTFSVMFLRIFSVLICTGGPQSWRASHCWALSQSPMLLGESCASWGRPKKTILKSIPTYSHLFGGFNTTCWDETQCMEADRNLSDAFWSEKKHFTDTERPASAHYAPFSSSVAAKLYRCRSRLMLSGKNCRDGP